MFEDNEYMQSVTSKISDGSFNTQKAIDKMLGNTSDIKKDKKKKVIGDDEEE